MHSLNKQLSKKFRRITASIRMLPDFLIIGAQRCGTTSLYRQICSHPWIVSATKKEVHFFDIQYNQGFDWYRSHFPTYIYRYYRKQLYKQKLLTGEASPYHIFHPLSPYRISQSLPGVKLIVLLRNPIDRAYSHYWHEVKRGTESLSFEDAIEQESERLYGERHKIILKAGAYHSATFQNFSYLARGIYADQIIEWFRLFPKGQFLILCSQEFYTEPKTALNKIFSFLEVPPCNQIDETKVHQGDYPDMAVDTRKELNIFFRPHNERLYKLLNKNFSWED